MQKVSTQKGFTLIELIIVIVLLGILAVTAAPKFLNLQDDARDSVLQGIAGSIESAASVVYGKALINGEASAETGSVNVGNGTTVNTVYGYPDGGTATNLTNLLEADIDNGGDYLTTTVAGSDPAELLIYYKGYTGYSTTAPTAANAPCTITYTNSSGEGVRPTINVVSCVQ